VTFDPMQPLNAYFNLGKLGVWSNSYLENLYGESTSCSIEVFRRTVLRAGGTWRTGRSWTGSSRVRRVTICERS